MLFRLFILMVLPAQLAAAPIVVQLGTEEQPLPVYLSVQGDDSYDKSYVTALDKVAQFDFNNNGKTTVFPRSQELDRLARTDAFKEQKHLKEWGDKGIEFLVNLAIKKGKLEAEVVFLPTKKIKTVQGITLNGKIDEDRRKIHALADTILETFFDTPGIATSRIAYTNKHRINSNHEVAEVWESDYDGANLKQLTQEKALCVTPTYLPAGEGKKSAGLCFVSYKTGQPKLKIVNLQDGTSQPLMRLRGQQMMPAFSPKKDRIAFISDLAGNPDLFLIDIDASLKPQGKPRQIYGNRYSTQGSPSFSPDGKQIAFVSNKDGKPRVYVMPVPAAGTNIEKINPTLTSKRPVEASAPAWSPDGTKIAYCAKTDQHRQIWVFEIATGKDKQVTSGSGDKENPSWAKDSIHLLYNAGGEIFLTTINLQKATRITEGKGQKQFAVWSW